ncbi:MAG TPA: hypothetical protein PK598_11095, partial [Thermoanaerobaculia bacterium]|nr:hypothetical protein [Thermoanaerobaculia bacterium]
RVVAELVDELLLDDRVETFRQAAGDWSRWVRDQGELASARDELLFGRCVIAWEPDVGPAELLAFVPEPRAREAP